MIPPGYSPTVTLFRSMRMFTNPIRAISRNLEKFPGSYSVVVPPKQLVILTQDPVLVNRVLKDNHTNYHRSPYTAGRMATFFGRGLLFANGDYWLRQRRLIQPGFHQKRLQDLFGIVLNTIRECLAEFPAGDGIDMYPVVHQMAFRVAIRSLFDIPLSPETMQELTDTFNAVQDFVVKDVNHPLRKLLYPLSGAEKRNLRKAGRLREIFRDILAARRAGGKHYGDLLDMLLEARYEDTGLPMTDEQILDEIQVLVFAGHETTADTLSWLLFLLASEPGIQQRLRDISSRTDILESPRNEYVNAVIDEGMRLYPAGWMTDRMALEDDQAGDYSYPKGTIIMSFFYGMHRDPKYWDDPARFNPERFLDAEGKLLRPRNYFPFGGGPRLCIGNHFAIAEMSLFLHAFFGAFTLSPTGRAPLLRPLITLRPDKVLLNVKKLTATH